jgi:hypothetical protein
MFYLALFVPPVDAGSLESFERTAQSAIAESLEAMGDAARLRYRSSSERAQKVRRSLSSIRTSLIPAARRRIRQCSSSSHSSLP